MSRIMTLLTSLAVIATCHLTFAAATGNDPEKVDADYAVQGEFTGKIKTGDGESKYGVQVIAQGKSKFNGVGYPGGLPGDGWDKKNKDRATGQTADGKTKLSGKTLTFTVQGDELTVTNTGGDVLGKLKRVKRKSPTLGAKPPKGAVVLFDGTSLDNFTGVRGRGKARMTKDGLLMEGADSKQKFQSHTLHIEFRTPYKPEARGQGRGNSGVYLQSRYEVQVLDSFGLEGKMNECGGVYSIASPLENMCFPPLTWQTYDIDFTTAQFDEKGKKTKNGHMTVRHNGVVIHKDLDLTHRTTASPLKEGPQPGPIHLQGHGNPVRYRNIWVIEKK